MVDPIWQTYYEKLLDLILKIQDGGSNMVDRNF